jgi:hypothetical protein
MLKFSIFYLFFYLTVIIDACSVTDTKWTNFTSKLVNVEPDNTKIKHQIGGSVKILDGCTFFVRNITVIPTGNSAYWWGIPVRNNTDPYPRVVTAALGSYNGQGITFNLDPQYSFDEISIMEIYGEGDNRAYGAFALSGNISQNYGLTNDPTLNTDPENPWTNSSNTLTCNMFWIFTIITVSVLFVM